MLPYSVVADYKGPPLGKACFFFQLSIVRCLHLRHAQSHVWSCKVFVYQDCVSWGLNSHWCIGRPDKIAKPNHFGSVSVSVYLLLSKVHFSDLFEGQHYLKKIYILIDLWLIWRDVFPYPIFHHSFEGIWFFDFSSLQKGLYQGYSLGLVVPNGHTRAGFTIGALMLMTMATLHLRALHKTKTCSSIAILIPCQIDLIIGK